MREVTLSLSEVFSQTSGLIVVPVDFSLPCSFFQKVQQLYPETTKIAQAVDKERQIFGYKPVLYSIDESLEIGFIYTDLLRGGVLEGIQCFSDHLGDLCRAHFTRCPQSKGPVRIPNRLGYNMPDDQWKMYREVIGHSLYPINIEIISYKDR